MEWREWIEKLMDRDFRVLLMAHSEVPSIEKEKILNLTVEDCLLDEEHFEERFKKIWGLKKRIYKRPNLFKMIIKTLFTNK